MNIFLTGGSRGLGREIVLEAARRGIGVAFTFRETAGKAEEIVAQAKELAAGRGEIKAYQLDICDSAQVETVADKACDDFETIDAVVNNAAIVRDSLAFTMSDKDWRDVIDTNLTGTFWVTRQFLGHFLANKGGRFVHVSSIVADGGSGQVNYAASKAALVGLSRSIAKEYGRKGVLSNIVIPGFLDTGLAESNASDLLQEFWEKFCPLGRVTTGKEFADLVLYLCSDGPRFLSGEAIHVTGGLTYTP